MNFGLMLMLFADSNMSWTYDDFKSIEKRKKKKEKSKYPIKSLSEIVKIDKEFDELERVSLI